MSLSTLNVKIIMGLLCWTLLYLIFAKPLMVPFDIQTAIGQWLTGCALTILIVLCIFDDGKN